LIDGLIIKVVTGKEGEKPRRGLQGGWKGDTPGMADPQGNKLPDDHNYNHGQEIDANSPLDMIPTILRKGKSFFAACQGLIYLPVTFGHW